MRLPLFSPPLPAANVATCELHNVLELFSLPAANMRGAARPVFSRAYSARPESSAPAPTWRRCAAHVAIAYDVFYRFSGLQVDNAFLEFQPDVDDFAAPMWRIRRIYNSISLAPTGDAPDAPPFRPFSAVARADAHHTAQDAPARKRAPGAPGPPSLLRPDGAAAADGGDACGQGEQGEQGASLDTRTEAPRDSLP